MWAARHKRARPTQRRNGTTPCDPSGSCGFTAPQLEAAYDIAKDLGKGVGLNEEGP
jgi:hypothetical protein